MSNFVANLKENYFNNNNINNNFLTLETQTNELNFNRETHPTSYEEKMKNNKINKKIFNFSKIIDRKKKEIKNICIKNFGRNLNRKPSALKLLENGMKKFYFDQDSFLLRKFPLIRKKMMQEKAKKKHDLDQKINAGALLFYNLKNTNSSLENRKANVVTKYLKRSSIFEFKPAKDTIQNEFQKIIRKKKRESLLSRKSISEIPNEINNNKISLSFRKNHKSRNNENFFNNNNNKLVLNNFYTTPKSKKLKSKLILLDTNEINKSDLNSISTRPKTMSNFFLTTSNRDLILKKKTKKEIKNKINTHVDLLQTSTNNLNNQLLKIVEKNYEKDKKQTSMNFLNKIDYEEILDIKKRKEKKGIKDIKDFIKAASNDEYAIISGETAEILKITDDVTKMPDDVALFFVDRATKKYLDKINVIDEINNDLSPFLANLKFKKQNNLRKKVENNFVKIKQKTANLVFEKEKWKKIMKNYCEKS